MYKLWVIAHREYVAMVGTKAFLFTLVMMPILMFGSFLVMPLLSRVSAGKSLTIVVADGTSQFFDAIVQAADQRNQALRALAKSQSERSSTPGDGDGSVDRSDAADSPFLSDLDYWEIVPAPAAELSDAQRLELSRQIRNGEIHAFAEIPIELTAPPGNGASSVPKYYSQDAMISGARMWLSGIVNQRLRQIRIKQFDLDSIDPKIFAQLDARTDFLPALPLLETSIKPDGDVSAETPRDPLTALFLPFGVMMLMFLVILMAAQPMLETAMEEKGQRISEVLLGSVSATQLMGGKLMGNVAGSLLIFVLYGAGSFFFLNMRGMGHLVPLELLPWFLLFQLLGVLFFSSIFLTVGVSVNELKEAQTLLLPVWLVLMAPMMIWIVAIREPNGIVATAMSFFPPSCPLMMVLRLASGTVVPFWQPPLAALIMLASTIGMVAIAGRIYRNGLLRTDGVRSITQLIKRSFSRA